MIGCYFWEGLEFVGVNMAFFFVLLLFGAWYCGNRIHSILLVFHVFGNGGSLWVAWCFEASFLIIGIGLKKSIFVVIVSYLLTLLPYRTYFLISHPISQQINNKNSIHFQ